MSRFPRTRKTLRNFARYMRFVDRQAWKYHRGGGLVIGLMFFVKLIIVAVELLRRDTWREVPVSEPVSRPQFPRPTF